ncbi:hypothetical protein ISF6_1059 [Piscinibacter sakaiensis]|uniref:CHAT domain-containing protein n=1 Tax=Piscinibacter sakaiensis TaxID=1547922 RepID=A0A0K8NU67_PISS1|nr:hypothetical protein ISF6_1059 [Piscinibacter sakaiensis]
MVAGALAAWLPLPAAAAAGDGAAAGRYRLAAAAMVPATAPASATVIASASDPVPATASAPASDAAAAQALAEGRALRDEGQLTLAAVRLREAREQAQDPALRARAAAALGATLLQARRLDAAQEALQAAEAGSTGRARAAVAIDLGSLAALRGLPERARAHWQAALADAGSDPAVAFAAGLNLARLAPAADRLAALQALLPALQAAGPGVAARRVALAEQARRLGPDGDALAHAQFDAARADAAAAGAARLEAEALDGLAALYEARGRGAEARTLNRQAEAAAARAPAASLGELGIRLAWREARLARSAGEPGQALAAWQRAVARLEAVRQDLPIDDEDGASTFRSLLEPVYLGLVEGLLAAADDAPAARQPALLRQAVDTLELVRQAEMQDYLGDRCDVDAVKGGSATVIPVGSAVLYPVALPDRLELLLDTGAGLRRARSAVAAAELRETAQRHAASLRAGRAAHRVDAGRLYDWLLRPIEPLLAAAGVDTLVVVPDGALRLVAFGALFDGQRYAIEQRAITTSVGLSMTHTGASSPRARRRVLLAGLASPGPVVDKLSPAVVTRLLGPQEASRLERQAGAARATEPGAPAAPAGAAEPAAARAEDRTRALQEALALPGVEREVEAIARIAPHVQLLDRDFTVAAFRAAAETGDYPILHVASHGVFGGSADASYVLAYDDLLTLDGLQALLRSDRFRRNPVELLSLSACETAEGDERSPLGLSGAAIKARAKSVLGSLWPVADDAAVPLMAGFYDELLRDGRSKARALQAAQVALLRQRAFAHPFYWAPFILIGNWL